jgi:hypothetical protein
VIPYNVESTAGLYSFEPKHMLFAGHSIRVSPRSSPLEGQSVSRVKSSQREKGRTCRTMNRLQVQHFMLVVAALLKTTPAQVQDMYVSSQQFLSDKNVTAPTRTLSSIGLSPIQCASICVRDGNCMAYSFSTDSTTGVSTCAITNTTVFTDHPGSKVFAAPRNLPGTSIQGSRIQTNWI